MCRLTKSDAWLLQQQSASAVLESMRYAFFLTDIVIVCGNREFPAHRCQLSAASPYFMAMFRSGMKEGAASRVELKGISGAAMSVVMDFMYTGFIPDIDENDLGKLRDIIHAADFLHIQALFDFCLQEWTKKLNVRHFVYQWQIAELYKDDSFLDKAAKQLAISFKEISQGAFVEMGPSQLERILTHPDLKVEPNDLVVERILVWVKFAEDDRANELEHLLSLVNLSRLTVSYMTLLFTEPLIWSKADLFWRLETALKSCSRSDLPPLPPRLLFFDTDEFETLSEMMTYEVGGVSGLIPIVMPFHCAHETAVIAHEGSVYFAGGDEQSFGKAVYKYTPATHSAHLLCHLRDFCFAAGVGILHGMMYLVAGLGGDDFETLEWASQTVQRVSLATGECETLAQTNKAYHEPFVFALNGFLYLIGVAYDNAGSVERYSALYNQWTMVTVIKESVFPCLATLFDGKVVLCSETEAKLVSYDPHYNVWQRVDDIGLPDEVHGVWSVELGERKVPTLIVRGMESTLYAYDTLSRAWTSCKNFRVPYGWLKAVLVC